MENTTIESTVHVAYLQIGTVNQYVLDLVEKYARCEKIYELLPYLLYIDNGSVYIVNGNKLSLSNPEKITETKEIVAKDEGIWTLEAGQEKEFYFKDREEFDNVVMPKSARRHEENVLKKVSIRHAFEKLDILISYNMEDIGDENEEELFNSIMIDLYGPSDDDIIEHHAHSKICMIKNFKILHRDRCSKIATAERGEYFLFFVLQYQKGTELI